MRWRVGTDDMFNLTTMRDWSARARHARLFLLARRRQHNANPALLLP
jgi:predicted alpha/beta hydrolase